MMNFTHFEMFSGTLVIISTTFSAIMWAQKNKAEKNYVKYDDIYDPISKEPVYMSQINCKSEMADCNINRDKNIVHLKEQSATTDTGLSEKIDLLAAEFKLISKAYIEYHTEVIQVIERYEGLTQDVDILRRGVSDQNKGFEKTIEKGLEKVTHDIVAVLRPGGFVKSTGKNNEM